MKLSLSWLHAHLSAKPSATEVCDALTRIGLEVESVSSTGAPQLDHVVVGEVLSREKHPEADKLGVCQVDIGDGSPLQIVCGASNYKVGDRVPVALPGANLPTPDGKGFKIGKSKLRGVESAGMMCSARELGMGEDHSGLLILPGVPTLGAPINDVLPKGDTAIEISVTPNRADCLSHTGVARELAAFFKAAVVWPEPRVNTADSKVLARRHPLNAVSVEAPDACPHYRAYGIRGVKVGPSPEWMQERLKAVGLRPINNIVDITNYVLMELGQPLHAFDAARIGWNQIVVRMARDGEVLKTLDDKERKLDPSMLVIADGEKPLVLAGIMGGVDSGVSESTTDIVLEAAQFESTVVRRTSRRLGLSSDSSYRYERGIDPMGVAFAAQRAIDLILEIAGGELCGPCLVSGQPPIVQREVSLPASTFAKVLGFEIPQKDILDMLERLGVRVSRHETNDGDRWDCAIPSWRLDLERPIDLVEEVLRLNGTDSIPKGRVECPGMLREDDAGSATVGRMARMLAAKGFVECMHYTTREAAELQAWWSAKEGRDLLPLANPLASDQGMLRCSIIPGLLDALALNFNRQNEPLRLFETGSVFRWLDGEFFELQSVAFVMVQSARPDAWKQRPAPDFFDAKAVVEQLAAAAGIDPKSCNWTPVANEAAWQAGHAAAAGAFRRKYEARVGLLNLRYTKSRDIPGTVLAGELLLLPEFLRKRPARATAKAFSSMPAVTRDVALLVDAATSAERVRVDLARATEKAAGNAFAVESVAIFDVYQGDNVPAGKKSLAFRMTFRHASETLTDKVVNPVFESAVRRVCESGAYAVRSS